MGSKSLVHMTQLMQAVSAFNAGDQRRAADCYMKAILSTKNDKWVDMPDSKSDRFYHFRGYTSIIRERYFTPTQQDVKTLKKLFFNNEEEPLSFRVEAGFALAYTAYADGDRELAADYYRESISLSRKVSEEERARECNGTQVVHGTVQIVTSTVGAFLDEQVEAMERNLHNMENRLPHPRTKVELSDLFRSDGSFDPVVPTARFKNADPSAISKELEERLLVGGRVCDLCKKTRDELGMEQLLIFSRCKMAYYCSKGCQRTAWNKNGHKLACRKEGEIKEGDVLQLQGLVGIAEKNGLLVQAVSAVSENRWKVQVIGSRKRGGEFLSVAVKNLKHIRPERYRRSQVENFVLGRITKYLSLRAEDVFLPESLIRLFEPEFTGTCTGGQNSNS